MPLPWRHHSILYAADMQTAMSGGALPQLSFDGYVRLTFDAFIRVTFGRKSSWEDSELASELRADDVPAAQAGYCEWSTQGRVVVSLGWAWFQSAQGPRFVAPGGVSSNVMLVTPMHYDLGAQRTAVLLRSWLSGVNWWSGLHRIAH